MRKSDPPSPEKQGLWRGKHAEVGMRNAEQSCCELRVTRCAVNKTEFLNFSHLKL